MTIVGTRPEIIRLSRIIPKLDKICNHTLVHTGQNHSHNLNDIFFDELGIRNPNHYLDAAGDHFAETIGHIVIKIQNLFQSTRPDKVLILGDTDSGLSAIVAKRMGIPVYHMEAGNRCFNDEVPEEINRRIIDSCSDLLLPYTNHSRQYLLKEGYHPQSIIVTGNPIHEVVKYYLSEIDMQTPLKKLNITSKNYFLVTLHRAENVDHIDRLKTFIQAFEDLATTYNKPVLISVHPRLRKRINEFGIKTSSKLLLLDAFGFFEFVKLQKDAFCVLSDSGTVPEECSILNVPVVLLRSSTERPELLECGAMIMTGRNPQMIIDAVRVMTSGKMHYDLPIDYKDTNVSDKIAHILLSDLTETSK